MNDFKTIRPDEIRSTLLSQAFDVLRIAGKFDLRKYRQITTNAIQEHKPKLKDGYDKYSGLGLQFTDESDPYYDAVDQVAFIDANGNISSHRKSSYFARKNDVGEMYDEFHSYFAPECILTRGRILIAAPGFKMTPHTDGEFCATLHFPIQTDPDCFLHVAGRPYSLPADGHFYLVNVAKPHHVTNESKVERIHITYPLSPLHFHAWKRSELNAMSSFFKMFKITDLSIFKHLTIDETN